MYQKIKLTNLRHLETSKEEMEHLKGGDDPEKSPFTCQVHCDCSVACHCGLNDQENLFELTRYSNAGRSTASSVYDTIGVLMPFPFSAMLGY